MSKTRPSVSMKREVFRRMAYAADTQTRTPRCAWVEQAIEEKLERDRARSPPDDWTPEDRRGRPPRAETVAKDYFTY